MQRVPEDSCAGWLCGQRGPEDVYADRGAQRTAVQDGCVDREAQKMAVQTGAQRMAVQTEGPRGRDRLAACRLALSELDFGDCSATWK